MPKGAAGHGRGRPTPGRRPSVTVPVPWAVAECSREWPGWAGLRGQDRSQGTLRDRRGPVERRGRECLDGRVSAGGLIPHMVGEVPERGPQLELGGGRRGGGGRQRARPSGRGGSGDPCSPLSSWPFLGLSPARPLPAPDSGSGPGCSRPAHPRHQDPRPPHPCSCADCSSHFPRLGWDTRFFQKHFLCKIILRNMFLETDS